MTGLDLIEWGEKARDRGMDRALDAACRDRPDFEQIIINALWRIARRQEVVHANDLYREIFEPRLVRRPENFNCMGGIWRRCANPDNGFLLMTNKTKRCIDPLKRAHRSPEYLSLIFKGNRDAAKFARLALKRCSGFVALLLTAKFDFGKTRVDLFTENPRFCAKIALIDRIQWFPGDSSGTEDHAWYVWSPTPGGGVGRARLIYEGRPA